MQKSQTKDCLSWVRFVTVFLSPSRQILEHYLKMLSHPFQLTMETYAFKKMLFKPKSEKVFYPPLCEPEHTNTRHVTYN